MQRLLSFARKQELRPRRRTAGSGDRDARALKRSVETNISIDLRFPLDLPQAYVDANQLEMVLINPVVNARTPCRMADRSASRDSPEQPPKQEESMRPATSFLSFETTVSVWSRKFLPALPIHFYNQGPRQWHGAGFVDGPWPGRTIRGRLQIHSRPGKGTTVEIWLPIATERQAEQTPDRVEPSPGPQLTASAELSLSVPVVDDDPLVLDNTASMLEDLGCRVTAVNSAETALGLLTQRVAYDILITDHMMPGMTGAQLADRLRNERPELPVLWSAATPISPIAHVSFRSPPSRSPNRPFWTPSSNR